jgi:hypothetical protein
MDWLDDINRLSSEAKSMNAVVTAEPWCPGWDYELDNPEPLRLFVGFPPEAKELPVSFRWWLRENDLVIMSTGLAEDDHLGLYVTLQHCENTREVYELAKEYEMGDFGG